jgi:hypothetical protein
MEGVRDTMSVMRDSARGARQATKIKDRIAGYQANRSRREAMFEQAFKRASSRSRVGDFSLINFD